MPDFNREMLTLARECRGFTQSKLAEEVSISQAEISKFETGMRIPTDKQARRLASCLRFLVDFFYLAETMRSFGSGCVYHRKRQSATEMKLRQLLALVNVRRIQIVQLLNSVEPKNQYRFEYLDIDEHQGNAGRVAQVLRAMWKLPPGPVQSVIGVIENAGGIVLRCDFGTDKVDALSQWLPGLPPVFLMNDRIPPDRMRWTLMHEVGHILMHRFPTDRMEREADEFAAEMLMPAREIKPHLADLSLPKLANLKPYWRVAMSALLRRASDLGTINPRTKQYLWTQMGMRGYRKHEPVNIPPEELFSKFQRAGLATCELMQTKGAQSGTGPGVKWGMKAEFYRRLVAHVNRKEWWHAPPAALTLTASGENSLRPALGKRSFMEDRWMNHRRLRLRSRSRAKKKMYSK